MKSFLATENSENTENTEENENQDSFLNYFQAFL